jgi:hypothetical protein
MLIPIVKLKYCPNCGTQLTIGTAKFCHNSGKNLWSATQLNQHVYGSQEEDIFRVTSDSNHASVIDGHEREDKSNSFKPIYSFGIKLEEMVEKA